MPLDPSVVFQTKLAKAVTGKFRFQRLLMTFVPTGGLVAGFTELAIKVTADNWKTQLKARGGDNTDLIWQALAQFWAPAFAPAGSPARAAAIPDYIIIGRRTTAEPTKWTATVSGTLDGVYTLGAYGFGEVTFEADGNTAAEIRDGLGDAWNALAALADVSSAVDNGVAAVDLTTDTDGFPFIVYVKSTGSPITLVNATVAGDYEADLDVLMDVVIDPVAGTKVKDAVYFIRDLQDDDQTNRQAVDWCVAQKETDTTRTYLPLVQSYHPGIPNAGVTNDPASTLKNLLVPKAEESNDRGALVYEPIGQSQANTLAGRCIGYNLGRINFAQRELVGITPANLDDNEVVATIKYFNFYSPESPKGNTKWGYLCSGRFIDDLWAEDILSHEGRIALLELLVAEDALDYTDQGGISSGKSAIVAKLSKYAGRDYGYLLPDSIVVIAGKRKDQPGIDLEERRFVDYTVSAQRANLINRYGSVTSPINFTISV